MKAHVGTFNFKLREGWFQALSTTHRDVEVELRGDDHGGRHLLEQLVRGLGGEEEGVGPLGVQVPGDVLPDLLLALGNENGGSKTRYRLQSATKALLSTTNNKSTQSTAL